MDRRVVGAFTTPSALPPFPGQVDPGSLLVNSQLNSVLAGPFSLALYGPDLIAVSDRGQPYQLRSRYVRFHLSFGDWVEFPAPPSGAVLTRATLTAPFAGRTLRTVATLSGARAAVCVGSDNAPYFIAEQTPGDASSYPPSWSAFSFDGEQEGVIGVAATATGGYGVVAYLAAPADPGSPPRVLVSYQINALDPTAWTPLTPAAEFPLQGPLVTVDAAGTQNGALLLALALVEDDQLEWAYATSTANPGLPSAQWFHSPVGSSSYPVDLAAVALGPLGYQFALTRGGGLGVVVPAMGPYPFEANEPEPGVIQPVAVYRYMYSAEALDIGPAPMAPPGLGVAPPYMFVDAYNRPVEFDLDLNSTQEVGFQDVFCGFNDEFGNASLRAITMPLTINWIREKWFTGVFAGPKGRKPLEDEPEPAFMGGYLLPDTPNTSTLTLPADFGLVVDVATGLTPPGVEIVVAVGATENGTNVCFCTGSGQSGAPGRYIQDLASDPVSISVSNPLHW